VESEKRNPQTTLGGGKKYLKSCQSMITSFNLGMVSPVLSCYSFLSPGRCPSVVLLGVSVAYPSRLLHYLKWIMSISV
jgi:hypothetical protein